MFAKLYENDGKQILVKLDGDEMNAPEVRFFFEPEGLGVCSAAVQWKNDNDHDWDKAEEFFKGVDAEKANAFVDGIINEVAQAV